MPARCVAHVHVPVCVFVHSTTARYLYHSVLADMSFGSALKFEFWVQIFLLIVAFWLRIYLHYVGMCLCHLLARLALCRTMV